MERKHNSKIVPFAKEAFERSTVMNFTTWFVIAIAIIVPVSTFIFHNKE